MTLLNLYEEKLSLSIVYISLKTFTKYCIINMGGGKV